MMAHITLQRNCIALHSIQFNSIQYEKTVKNRKQNVSQYFVFFKDIM